MAAKASAAQVAITADAKKLDPGLRDAKKKLKGFGSELKKVGGKIFGGGKGALDKLGTGLGIQAASGITESISAVRNFERNLVRFQIASGKSTGEMDMFRRSVMGVSKETAVSNEDILAGVQTYVDLTGDVAGAEQAMRSFARIAQASGAEVSDVATATAALKESMKLDPGDIEAVFSGLIQQGKAGAVSLKDFAGELSSLAPQFAKFGGSGVKGIADLGAALQVARKGFGSASEAATGMQNLFTALSRNADKFQQAGVRIYDKDPKTGAKRFRSFLDIVDEIGRSRLAKDPTLLTKAFGSVEAQQAYDMLRANRGELEKIYEAGLDAGAVQRDLNTFMSSSAGRLDVAMNNLKIAIVSAFTPERIEKFVGAVEKAVGAVDKLFSLMGQAQSFWSGQSFEQQNPFKGDPSWWDPLDIVGSVRGDENENPNSDMYRTKGRDIRSRGTREEQVREAVQAKYSVGNGPGQEGVRAAGKQFISEAGVSQAEEERARTQLLQQYADTAPALKSLTATLQKLVDVGITVKMDSSAVAKSADNARVHRGG